MEHSVSEHQDPERALVEQEENIHPLPSPSFEPLVARHSTQIQEKLSKHMAKEMPCSHPLHPPLACSALTRFSCRNRDTRASQVGGERGRRQTNVSSKNAVKFS
ncbi:hypothetical protein VTH06DRAFT_1685 [Thermothelomyces fergusii]